MRILFEILLLAIIVMGLLYVASRLFPAYFRQEGGKGAGGEKKDGGGEGEK